MAVFSTIKKSQLEGGQRLDAEYYQPEYLKVAQKLDGSPTIVDVAEDVRYGLYVEPDYLEEGVDFIRAMNTTNFWIDGEVLKISRKKVPEEYLLRTGDCLIVRSGANTGLVSVIYPNFAKATFGSYTIRLRFDKVNPFFAAVFLNTKYGLAQTQRSQTGAAQPNLNIPNINEIRIPQLSERLQKETEDACLSVFETKQFSESLYSQAEKLLLKELGLEHFEEEVGLWSVVKLSEAQAAGRIDAEYFQPKYETLIAKLQKNNAQLLGDLVTMKKGVEPGSEAYTDEGKLFIRVSSISRFGLADKDQKYISDRLYRELKNNYEPKVGEILLTKDASPGVACVLREKMEGVVSGGVMRLKVKEGIDAEYVALCINSIVGRLQVERDAGGSIIAHWKPDQIKQLQIPVLPDKTQQKIAELVRQSHEARAKAKQLLEDAKRKVEELIESISTTR